MAKKISKRVVEQRKRIAKDVLEQIRVGRFNADVGAYIYDYDWQYLGQRVMEAKLQTPERRCGVCAIGSMFVAAVDRYNRVTVGDVKGLGDGPACRLEDSDRLTGVLSRWWSPVEMRVIEAAFERNDLIACYAPDVEVTPSFQRRLSRARDWGSRYEDDTERLQAICKKIIRSVDGSFRV